jgi:hypothetical protein
MSFCCFSTRRSSRGVKIRSGQPLKNVNNDEFRKDMAKAGSEVLGNHGRP